MRSTLSKLATGTLAQVGVLAIEAGTAGAQVPVDPNAPRGVNTNFQSVPQIINTIFRVVIAAAGAIFIIMFLIGGIQYLTAAGNEEATGKARKLLVDSIVGLIIVLAAWAVGTWVLAQLGLRSETTTRFTP